VALYDIDGTTTGAAIVSSSVTINHDIVDPIVGAATVTGDTIAVFDVSGYVVGSGDLIDDSLKDATGVIVGGSSVSGELLRYVGVRGFTQGSGTFVISEPEPIVGVGVVTQHMDVIHVPPPICLAPTVCVAFRYGHVFTEGDLCYSFSWGDPACVSYTLYQMVQGCVLRQIGPSGRKPVKHKSGCYYVTGTAGDCGQPGLWVVRWCWQRTFTDPVMVEDRYFQVMDSVSCPIPGDTLERYCKYGW
jgi:hypothetical protein